MSFFDEVDEPLAEPSNRPRARRPGSGRGGRPPGGGSRGPRSDQAIRTRRLVAGGALIVVLILIVVGVHSCQVSQANSDLRDYSANVSSLVQRSNQTSQQFFQLLSSGQGGSDSSTLHQQQVDEARLNAENQLNDAKALSAPGQLGERAGRFRTDDAVAGRMGSRTLPKTSPQRSRRRPALPRSRRSPATWPASTPPMSSTRTTPCRCS